MSRSRRSRYPARIDQVRITGLADKGFCVGKTPAGEVVFVEKVVPGDVVDVRPFKKRKKLLFATPLEWRQRSADRVEPFCQHFGVCGGCKWQDFSYAGQLREKDQIVRDALTRIGKIEVGQWEPILGSEATSFYRNKLEFGVANRRWLTAEEVGTEVNNEANVIGFHKAGAYDKLIEIEECHLQHGPSNLLRNGIQALAIEMGVPFFDMRERTGLFRQFMIRTTTTGQCMLVLAFFTDDQARIQPFLSAIMARFGQHLTSLYYCINGKINEYMMDLEMVHFAGTTTVVENLGHVNFHIGPKSFFQTNTRQGQRLYDITAEYAGLTGQENVYDLYTGIGSIGQYLAKDARAVVGIEEIAAAIEDAKVNAALNGLDNCTWYAGQVEHILTPEFAAEHGRPDVLITDPPRAGMHPKVLPMLLELAAPVIVYVSCNPATQARDLAILAEKYRVVKARAVDMFPQTSHVESVVRLELC
ncbi:23S rRNA (uracil(1939)-C(5))-methyltransferase RlmD [Neolewinella lacunae]|uniref:23S rRNA (Uracil(1939)-C(5))-methyltransferase RlmD n=1 Tax=Neolewinella lacunae TaxID=1517758 RepID=A0A923PRF4_9BACT|nr:23S rRNA (uracil(1939)-C(5))-methyltransferase RlmD [Neolewinella lacunae]MBC6996124.1 23S rRNA (uracil(1939)-C(5))-methyltransferase RlmD [Neolewinella lacunae]MDN3633977.1 23S rRNA (uracil(1939)-C(5))-methyltransferase RlmD [Neolewinella lacunae]